MKLTDIARLAKVSPATVSRVFSHHPNISSGIRNRVLSIAKKHGYHPRLSGKQRNVVILVPGDDIYPIRNCLDMVMASLTRELPARKFRIEIMPRDNMERLDSIQFCGAVALGAEPDDFKSWPNRFSAPLVLIDRDAPERAKGVYSVRSDEAQGMDLALSHLQERGCRKIGCIVYGRKCHGNTDARYAGIIDSLKKHGLPARDSLVHTAYTDNYVELIGKLLKQDVDALFCPGGNAGVVVAYALSLFNKRVPDDVSLITSEYTVYSRYATPPQTTISQDHTKLAAVTADSIESHFDAVPGPKRTVLPYHLYERDSVVSPEK